MSASAEWTWRLMNYELFLTLSSLALSLIFLLFLVPFLLRLLFLLVSSDSHFISTTMGSQQPSTFPSILPKSPPPAFSLESKKGEGLKGNKTTKCNVERAHA
jgi:hypothetical protein